MKKIITLVVCIVFFASNFGFSANNESIESSSRQLLMQIQQEAKNRARTKLTTAELKSITDLDEVILLNQKLLKIFADNRINTGLFSLQFKHGFIGDLVRSGRGNPNEALLMMVADKIFLKIKYSPELETLQSLVPQPGKDTPEIFVTTAINLIVSASRMREQLLKRLSQIGRFTDELTPINDADLRLFTDPENVELGDLSPNMRLMYNTMVRALGRAKTLKNPSKIIPPEEIIGEVNDILRNSFKRFQEQDRSGSSRKTDEFVSRTQKVLEKLNQRKSNQI